MVDTTMVGIIRSGTTSKTRRTNNQAVGLQKKRRVRPQRQKASGFVGEEQPKLTCNTRSNVRARTAGASQAHYTARSKTKTRSGRPVPRQRQNAKGQNRVRIRGDSDDSEDPQTRQTHEEEKRSDARLEARDGDARFPVQPTAEHAEK